MIVLENYRCKLKRPKADVFFSASTKQMNALVAEKLINKKVCPLLENQLVLIVPNQDQAKWHDFSDLKSPNDSNW